MSTESENRATKELIEENAAEQDEGASGIVRAEPVLSETERQQPATKQADTNGNCPPRCDWEKTPIADWNGSDSMKKG